MLKEFKTFIMKGNILDLAVAVIIGTAFKEIVSSFVKDIIMPPIGVLLGDVDFTDLAIVLVAATETSEAVTINYGLFIQTIVDFLIIGFIIFLVVRTYNRMDREKEEAPPSAPELSLQEKLLTEIRNLLQKQN